MPVSREEVYEALFALFSGLPQFATTGRRLAAWNSVTAQPALFLRPYKEDVTPAPGYGQRPVYEMTGEIWIYCKNGDPNGPGATQITDLIDLIDATLAANLTPPGRLTLGGRVVHCWRAGETIIADGAPQTQSAAIIPISILVNDLIVPRPKVLSLTCVPSTGTLTLGQSAVLSLAFNVPVTVTGGTPSMALSSGGTATLTGAASGTALAFDYVVGATDQTSNLVVDSIALNGATITDQYGKESDLTIAAGQPPGVLVIVPVPTSPDTPP